MMTGFQISGKEEIMTEAQKASTDTSQNTREVIKVAKDVDQVSCEGGLGPLGHPIVWYSFDGRDQVICKYCDRLFTKV